MIKFTNKVDSILKKWHRMQSENPQLFRITNQVRFHNDDTIGLITYKFKFGKRELSYNIVVTERDDGIYSLAGTIISANNIPIARSRLKYKSFEIYIRGADDLMNALFVKIWPEVRYWQDVTQLSWLKINTFELLYGKVSGLLNKLKKEKKERK